ncbi:MAG: IS1380 family transposase [Gammaproteobacteria bacterium]
MGDDSTGQSVVFSDLFGKPLVAQFDQAQASSDGGAVLLKAADTRLGLSARLAAYLEDGRQAGKVRHAMQELFRQRMFAIACGYADGNDAARLAHDPIQKLLCDRAPSEDEALASQPTLSRFENAAGRGELYRLGEALAASVIERHRRRLGSRGVRRVTIDLDPTDDPTHGEQQLSFFNTHYNGWCYLPTAGFLTFNQEPEQYLFAYVLRAGNAHAKLGAVGILKRVIERLHVAFPRTRIRVRLDGGFACPELFEFLEAARVEYVVAMAENAVLARKSLKLLRTARRLSRASGATKHVYGECNYAAGTWSHKRRIVIKAEVVRLAGREPKDNPRFVVTNLTSSPQHLYENVYCARGEIENRIKELHWGLEIDRTSCTRFLANQLRVLVTAAAYVLMQELRLKAQGTAFARAQVWTLRERLLKLGAWLETSVRRIVLHLPDSCIDRRAWCQLARALGAAPA